MDVREKDNIYFGRGGEAMDLEISRSSGSLVWDVNDDRFIDFHGGAGVGNLGWEKEEIILAIKSSDRPSYVFPHFYYKPWTELADLLATLTPKHLNKSFRTTGGSEAVEAAMQMAMMFTGRKKFLSVEGSYHGNTLGALSLGASKNKEKFHNLLFGCEKIAPPFNEETLNTIEEKVQNKEFAAFVMEPIICNLGVIIPEEDFMKQLDQLCKKHGTLLIMDEAITGFGRTGKFFASEHFDIKPDILCIAKAMSAGHAGIGAVITTEEIGEAVENKIGLYSSYGWHPISVDASIAAVKYLLNNSDDLFENSKEIGEIIKRKIPQIDFRKAPELRIKGMAIGLELQDKEYASEIRKSCLKNGLIIGTEGSSLVFFPALNIEKQLVEEGLEILSGVCTLLK